MTAAKIQKQRVVPVRPRNSSMIAATPVTIAHDDQAEDDRDQVPGHVVGYSCGWRVATAVAAVVVAAMPVPVAVAVPLPADARDGRRQHRQQPAGSTSRPSAAARAAQSRSRRM